MSNPHWELKDGKAVKKSRFPKAERSNDHTVDGLTLSTTVTRTMTFTLDQLQYAITADKLVGVPFTREEALDVFSKLVRANRLEMFGTYDGYSIITNGYGQFKSLNFSHSNPANAEDMFRMLHRVLDN